MAQPTRNVSGISALARDIAAALCLDLSQHHDELPAIAVLTPVSEFFVLRVVSSTGALVLNVITHIGGVRVVGGTTRAPLDALRARTAVEPQHGQHALDDVATPVDTINRFERATGVDVARVTGTPGLAHAPGHAVNVPSGTVANRRRARQTLTAAGTG